MSDPRAASRAPERDDAHGSDPGVLLAETIIASAWNLQGDANRAAFIDRVEALFGVALPVRPNTIARSDAATALWLGPGSWLLLARGTSPLFDFHAKRDALNEAGGALFDVSASRIAWRISGPRTATLLAKGCPLDFHPRAFASGTCAQSLFGHVNALFVNDGDGFTLMVARSFARDVWHALVEPAEQYGYRVSPPRPYP